MLANPYESIPYKESAWAEGFCKGLSSLSSPVPSDQISEEDWDAFNDGVAAGADMVLNGVAADAPCIAALEGSPGHIPGMVVDGVHLLHSGWEVVNTGKLFAGVGGLLMVVVSLVLSAHHALPAEQVLPQLGDEIAAKLASYGAGSLELFCGVTLDLSSEDCTMWLTPLYLSLDQARDAAIGAAGEGGWLVVSWRTDQSNSFRIVTSDATQ